VKVKLVGQNFQDALPPLQPLYDERSTRSIRGVYFLLQPQKAHQRLDDLLEDDGEDDLGPLDGIPLPEFLRLV